jgi:hypothetical protein
MMKQMVTAAAAVSVPVSFPLFFVFFFLNNKQQK